VRGTACPCCQIDIYRAIGDPSKPGGGGIYVGYVMADQYGDWQTDDLTAFPGMSGATINDVSFMAINS